MKGRDTWTLHHKWVDKTNTEQVHWCYEESERWIVQESRAAHMDSQADIDHKHEYDKAHYRRVSASRFQRQAKKENEWKKSRGIF